MGVRQYTEVEVFRVGTVHRVRTHAALDVDGYTRGITRVAYKTQINGGRGIYKPI